MDLKRMAAEKAAEYIKSSSILGLGTGSTSDEVLHRLAELLGAKSLTNIQGVPTSLKTEELARSLDIPLCDFNSIAHIDLTIDGADEFDAQLNVLKGQGGALTREKIVARASAQYIIAVDESKRVERLASICSLPIEVLTFGWTHVAGEIERWGARVLRREAVDGPLLTDQGNYILECRFEGGIEQPNELGCELNRIPGIVEHGLFLGMADKIIIAGPSGIEILERER